MLGLIFTGGEGPQLCAVKRLLETEIKEAQARNVRASSVRAFSVLFIAADSGLLAAENAGIKPDWIIGDFDSLPDISALSAYPQENIIRHRHDKDFTDTELAFSLAVEKGCGEIWLIGGGGGRIDHLFGIRSMFERDCFPFRWITASEDIRCIDAATSNNRVDASLDKDAAVSVFPVGSGPWKASSEGLRWKLSGLPWDRGFFGLSNVAVNGDLMIIAECGRFMVVLPLKNKETECRQ